MTRLCLDRLKSARAQRERYLGPWLPEPLVASSDTGWQQPEGRLDIAESVSLALLVLLETLTPLERAVFLLREVFDFEYDEIGRIVGRRADACRQLCSRAKQHVKERRPRFQSTAEERERLTHSFLNAVRLGDVATLTQLLAEDVSFWSDGSGKAAAALHPLHGREAVTRFVVGITRAHTGITAVPAEVNGGCGLVVWCEGQPYAVIALEFDGQQVRGIRAIANPDKLTHLRRPPGRKGRQRLSRAAILRGSVLCASI